ncbi:MAG: 1-deoxy-D-xylulose-5-phosphate reductoisomerase [Elusimicrobia bacterium RIFOXYA2_FULL_39_19]|nr:MAG: 1-deoxy-D-xylulose-5-phosphate reductoisomerase [Elusimicrobia bacterium RIFOXYA2_FULL_39_19]
MKNLVILGSTGSIGIQALEVARHLKSEIKVTGISSYSNINLLQQQIKEFKPSVVCTGNETDATYLRKKYKKNIEILSGNNGLSVMASYSEADIVLISVVGAVGIYPLISAIKAGKTVALANKEALVISGDIINKLLKEQFRETTCAGCAPKLAVIPAIIPVDSEHSAIFQCLKNEDTKKVKNLIVTGSGGPFYKKNVDFSKITVEEALNHPRWRMGKKITIDSATLMNKGLEIIEAHYMFDIPYNKIKLLIHPQSIVHSLVEFVDASVIGLFSMPDMRLSIQYAITYPERYPTNIHPLKLEDIQKLEFSKPDLKKFPCLKLALDCAKTGKTLNAVLNASNEVAVGAFLHKEIKFSDIHKVIEKVLNRHKVISKPVLEDILEADAWARTEAKKEVNKC